MKRILAAWFLVALMFNPLAFASPRDAMDVGLVGGVFLSSDESDLLGKRDAELAMGNGALSGLRIGYYASDLPIAAQVLAAVVPLTYSPGTLKGTGVVTLVEVLTFLEMGALQVHAGGGATACSCISPSQHRLDASDRCALRLRPGHDSVCVFSAAFRQLYIYYFPILQNIRHLNQRTRHSILWLYVNVFLNIPLKIFYSQNTNQISTCNSSMRYKIHSYLKNLHLVFDILIYYTN